MKQSKRDMLLELVRLGIIEVRDDGTIWKMKRISQSRPDGTDAIPQEPRRLGWSTADGYEPFVATDPDYPADVLAVYPKAREHGVVLWGPSESGKYEWRTADDAHCWTRSKSLWEENGWPKEGYHPTRDLALKHAPTSPPPGYVESKSYPSEPFSAAEAKAVLQEFGPKPDPKPSLIEACRRLSTTAWIMVRAQNQSGIPEVTRSNRTRRETWPPPRSRGSWRSR